MFTSRARRIALALACILLPHTAAAQRITVPGDRVRVKEVRTYATLLTGELIRMAGDTVTILSEAVTRTVVMVGTEHRLEASIGKRRRTVSGIGIGFLLGALTGGVLGAATHQKSEPEPEYFGDLFTSSSGSDAIAAAVVCTIPGMLIGGIVGSRFKSEQWRRVDRRLVRMGIAPAGGRGLRLAASVTF